MTVTRRTFLRKGAMTAMLTGLALESLPLAVAQKLRKQDRAAGRESAFSFRREAFAPYLDGAFTLSAGANSVGATLVGIRDYTANPRVSKVTKRSRPSDSFSLVFRSEEKLTGPASVYDVEHSALGKFPLFLSRREGHHGTYTYEAVFNHAL